MMDSSLKCLGPVALIILMLTFKARIKSDGRSEGLLSNLLVRFSYTFYNRP